MTQITDTTTREGQYEAGETAARNDWTQGRPSQANGYRWEDEDPDWAAGYEHGWAMAEYEEATR